MKTIKKWLGVVLTATLLSCQYQPANADVGSIPIPTNNVGLYLTYCEVLADFSATAMDARQYNVSYSNAVKAIPKQTTQGGKHQVSYLKSILDDVYTYPVLDSNQDKLWLSEQYSKLTYLECINK